VQDHLIRDFPLCRSKLEDSTGTGTKVTPSSQGVGAWVSLWPQSRVLVVGGSSGAIGVKGGGSSGCGARLGVGGPVHGDSRVGKGGSSTGGSSSGVGGSFLGGYSAG